MKIKPKREFTDELCIVEKKRRKNMMNSCIIWFENQFGEFDSFDVDFECEGGQFWEPVVVLEQHKGLTFVIWGSIFFDWDALTHFGIRFGIMLGPLWAIFDALGVTVGSFWVPLPVFGYHFASLSLRLGVPWLIFVIFLQDGRDHCVYWVHWKCRSNPRAILIFLVSGDLLLAPGCFLLHESMPFWHHESLNAGSRPWLGSDFVSCLLTLMLFVGVCLQIFDCLAFPVRGVKQGGGGRTQSDLA